MGSLRTMVIEQIAALMTAAFGLIAALAWNEAIKTLVAQFFDSEDGQLMGLFVYAIIVTIIAVVATIVIARAAAKAKAADAKVEAKK